MTEADNKNVFQRLLATQAELVAPRAISGRFGKARSAEQILEAAKPVCRKHGLYLSTTDRLHELNGRNYIVAKAIVHNVAKPEEFVFAEAAAWENEVSNGLDTSQVSGKTSSYAKKYALQNLFAIDDTQDADFDDPKDTNNSVKTDEKPEGSAVSKPSVAQLNKIRDLAAKKGIDVELTEARIKEISTSKEAWAAIKKLGE